MKLSKERRERLYRCIDGPIINLRIELLIRDIRVNRLRAPELGCRLKKIS